MTTQRYILNLDDKRKTKWMLMKALFHHGPVEVIVQGVTWQFASLEREDGSGECFNIHYQNGKEAKSIFVRTID